ncbi:MAG: hypothetical protein WDN76_03740 [Alphaproteobacteria bacterium]
MNDDLDALFALTADMSDRDLRIVSRVIEAVRDLNSCKGPDQTLAALEWAIRDVGPPPR